LQNYSEETFFHKKIWLVKPTMPVEKPFVIRKDTARIDISFLPEGGLLVRNTTNIIAFKAINQKGKGVSVSGKIINDLGDTITSFSSVFQGMGKFALMPEDGRNYFAITEQFPKLRFKLPESTSIGLSLQCKAGMESMTFNVSGKLKEAKIQEFYFVATHKGIELFHHKIEMTDNIQTVKIDKSLFPSGISKITLFDGQLNPITERLIFVNSDADDLVKLQVNQPVFTPRQPVIINLNTLLLPDDSISSTMSVSVVNRNYFESGENNQTIKSYLLLDSELKGEIESPAAFFINDTNVGSDLKLDLLMMVHGWRSYIWDEIERKPAASLEDWNDAGISISGYVKKLLWKAPLPEAEVTLGYVSKKFDIGKTTTNQNGRFHFRNVYVIDTLKVMLNVVTKNGTKNAEIIVDPNPVKEGNLPLVLPKWYPVDFNLNYNFTRDNFLRRTKELEFYPERGSILLKGIDIVEKRTNAFSRSFGEYVWADRTLTIIPDDYSFSFVLDYLQDKVNGLVRSGEEIMLANRAVRFTIDGTEADMKDLVSIRMADIELIDIMHPGFRRGFQADLLGVVDETGLIAIYQKTPFKPSIDYQYAKGRVRPEIRGFSPTKVFYSPKYTLENRNSPIPDYRPTLYWNADVRLTGGKTTLEFFTSDEKANYDVFVEGISKNGKICFGTTSFTVTKK
jgi:hypothetical protein